MQISETLPRLALRTIRELRNLSPAAAADRADHAQWQESNSLYHVVRRRIVFTSLEKFDGSSFRPLTAAEVKQIAGRAGRFGSSHSRGRVTCMHQVSTSAEHSLCQVSL